MTDEQLMNFFAYLKNDEIKRIPLNRELQGALNRTFEEKKAEFIPDDNDNILNFEENVGYKCEGEIFKLDNFEMPSPIVESIMNPVSLNELREVDYEEVKHIFFGKHSENDLWVAFIVFDKKKIIRRGNGVISILYRNGTFTEFDQKVLVIDNRIDALFVSEKLYFRSLRNVKRIFGEIIERYYRAATDDEVDQLANTVFEEDIPEEYLDHTSRKLIFGIIKNGTNYDLSQIVEIGSEKFNLSVELKENGKLSLPNSKKEFKKLLKLLNDDLFESPLTRAKYETNSKRKIS